MENKTRFGCFRPVTDHPLVNTVVAPVVSVMEGKELIETVCPVNKFNGHRESAFKLLGKLTGAKADVLNAVLQELPVVASDSRLTDEDRAQFVVERCSTGTPAEDALMAERIMQNLDALGLKTPDPSVSSDSKIEFSSSDAPDSKVE